MPRVGLMVLGWCGVLLIAAEATAPIRFEHRRLEFILDSCETPRRHAPETMAGGVAVFDYDNDGDLDIFFANGADIRSLRKSDTKYSNRLFANDGKAQFTDVTGKAGLVGSGYDMGAAVADYDNDGYKDLFVGGVHRNTLYHNNGDGTFTDVTARAGLETRDPQFGPLWSVGGAWLDANNDGLLDLFLVNYLAWNIDTEPGCEHKGHNEYCHPKFYKPTPNQLFLNLGGGKFRDVSESWGLRAHPGKGMGAAIADYDGDGRMDVFVTNDKLTNSLFRNAPMGRFEDVAFRTGVALAETGQEISGMGADSRDYDNDGWPDIVYVALDDESFPLFRNNRRGGFKDVTRSSGIMAPSLSMGGYSPNLADFDNDGWKDLFVSRGHVQSLLAEPEIKVAQLNSVFRNEAGTRFSPLTSQAGFDAALPARHRGSAVGDLDGDGRLDVVVAALAAPAEVWLNRSASGHWLGIRLEGTKSNRDGIGARLKVVTKAGSQYDHATSASGYASSSARPMHFGLGAEASAELVEITWPSGTRQILRDVPADRVVTVREISVPTRP